MPGLFTIYIISTIPALNIVGHIYRVVHLVLLLRVGPVEIKYEVIHNSILVDTFHCVAHSFHSGWSCCLVVEGGSGNELQPTIESIVTPKVKQLIIEEVGGGRVMFYIWPSVTV